MQVDFYHLTRQPLDRVLPQIAEKVLATGARLLIVVEDADERACLDRHLWTYAPDSFLPHACAGGENDGAQPILLAADIDAANGARMTDARRAWKLLKGREGVQPRYWKQNYAGRWEESG